METVLTKRCRSLRVEALDCFGACKSNYYKIKSDFARGGTPLLFAYFFFALKKKYDIILLKWRKLWYININ